jgi:hypothetical protein
VNANPSGSCTPPTGCWGRLDARRESASDAGLSLSLARFDACTGMSGRANRRVAGSSGGSRCAKTVRRGALNLRRAVQGRVGDQPSPRHVANHLVPHLFLSAKTSAPADAVRPHFPDRAWPYLAKVSTAGNAASRPKAQPVDCRMPRDGADGTELVQPGHDVIPTSARARSRGKGVLAA